MKEGIVRRSDDSGESLYNILSTGLSKRGGVGRAAWQSSCSQNAHDEKNWKEDSKQARRDHLEEFL